MASKGWIKLYRSIWENDLWKEQPFDRARAWIDLILLADTDSGGKYKRGSVYRGKEWLAKRWGWSVGKVTRFLEELEAENMITQKRTHGGRQNGTVLTIVKYGAFQDMRKQNDRQCNKQNDMPIRSKEEKEPVVLPSATDLIHGGYR